LLYGNIIYFNKTGGITMDVKDAIRKRRAYRSFEPIEITKKMIEELAEAAQLAPSCNNNQPWRYIFVHSQDVLKKMHEALPQGNAWAKAASMIIAVLSKKDMDCLMPDGREYYAYDTGAATGFLILRATEMGLVAHCIAGYDPVKVKEVLSIPEDMNVITLLIVGKHSEIISPLLSPKQAKSETERPERLALDTLYSENMYKLKEQHN
jgi:nitroreductase